jgi:CO/xanthine dehydrogenase Mo-binding subunit
MTYPYVHLAQVKVDMYVALRVETHRYFIAYEVGGVVNPMLIAGAAY